MKSTIVLFLVMSFLTLLSACAGPGAKERGQRMDMQAESSGWQKLRLPAGRWVLTAYASEFPVGSAPRLTVYLEGDGFAWRTGNQASDNPTPNNPVGLNLALRHPGAAVAYLARPCQNVAPGDWAGCLPSDWTHARYGPGVVAAMDTALSALKARAGANELVLVGYSGGGALAALLASGRNDVVRLVTVAANLDTDAWTKGHGLLPLSDSLNPADRWSALQELPQVHFVGDQDRVVPVEVTRSYARRFPAGKQPRIRIVSGADHSCCWATQWPLLAREAFP